MRVWMAAGITTACRPAVTPIPVESRTEVVVVVEVPEPGDADTPASPAPACDLQHDLDTPHLWEGDTVTFRVWCAGTSASTHHLEVLHPGAPSARLDPDHLFTWHTDGRDGGHHTLTLVATDPSGARPPETRVVDLWLADSPSAPQATLPDPDTYHEEWGLPVVHIQHEGVLTEADRPATVTVRGDSVDGEVKLRGATSLAYPKNSFTLDFDSADLQVDEWGPEPRGHMVLTSTFDDNSYIRQKLTFDVWAAMADSADERRLVPQTFFAVVYRNGVYEGLYVACDRVDDALAERSGWAGDGDLYKSVDHHANFDLVDSDGLPKADLAMGWEKKEGDDEADLSGIRALTDWVGNGNAERFNREHDRWVQAGSFRDWQLLVMSGQTEDSAGKNAYVYKADDTGQYSAMPWDFNASWGQTWKTIRRNPDRVWDHTEDNRLFLLQESDSASCAALVSRYRALRASGGPFDPAWLIAQIASYEAIIAPSARRDEARWGAEYRSFFRWADDRDEDDDWTDFAGELAYIRTWIPARVAEVDTWAAARCAE